MRLCTVSTGWHPCNLFLPVDIIYPPTVSTHHVYGLVIFMHLTNYFLLAAKITYSVQLIKISNILNFLFVSDGTQKWNLKFYLLILLQRGTLQYPGQVPMLIYPTTGLNYTLWINTDIHIMAMKQVVLAYKDQCCATHSTQNEVEKLDQLTWAWNSTKSYYTKQVSCKS